jgi:hypothetical protein
MTAMNDAVTWLSSPAGRVFQAERGGYAQAIQALVDADDQRHRDAYRFNTDRMARGLPAASTDVALSAVTPPGAVTVTGGTAELCKAMSAADPNWEWSFQSERRPAIPARVIG